MPTSTRTRVRNTVAMSPLLRKGGVHQRSKTGARADIKHEIEAEISNWQEEQGLSTAVNPQTESGDGSFIMPG